MEEVKEEVLLDQLLERINAIPGYRWERNAFHSSYDNWHFHGVKLNERAKSRTIGSTSASQHGPPDSPESRPTLKAHRSSNSESNVSTLSDQRSSNARLNDSSLQSADAANDEPTDEPLAVIGRVSSHILRLEREFQLSKLVVAQSDPDCEHFVRPLDLVHLKARSGQPPLVCSIIEAPGNNYLREIVELGPNAYRGVANEREDGWKITQLASEDRTPIPLLRFLDFAIGAAECLEILHHGNDLVHGEIRGDAFHFDQSSGTVRMVNFGSGARSFENGLTSAGWSALAREKGVSHKLQFIAPEQTGRLPAEPDLRTDLYSLGILFWTMMTNEPAFHGSTPLDIMQNVLSRRIPSLSSKRLDVPEALSAIVQRMTQKNIEERYHSTTGLKHDLVKLRELLYEGDSEGLKAFVIGAKDVSCSFTLPHHLIGRETQRRTIIDVIEKVSKTQRQSLPHNAQLYSISSNSSLISDRPLDDLLSDTTSSRDSDSRMNSISRPALDTTQTKTPQRSQDSILTSSSSAIAESNLDTRQTGENTRPSSNSGTTESLNPLFRSMKKLKRRGRCEVIVISGLPGLGKSSLIQAIQPVARSHGYFSSAKFDQVKRSPYEAILRLLSSLFRQIFSEGDVSTEFHENVRRFVAPIWSILHGYLDLPEWLIGNPGKAQGSQKSINALPRKGSSIDSRRASSPALHCGGHGNTAADFLRAGTTNKASRFKTIFLDVLQMLAAQRFICFCVDDLQFADRESLDLINAIVANKVPIVLILTCRNPELPSKLQPLLPNATRVELSPFTEEETAEFVCATLHRDHDYVFPLVAVIQEKTSGNPFFVREFLDTCNRKQCIYYSWKDSAWQFDLNRVFAEFESQAYGSQITNEFVTRRLQELPECTRKLLAWGSLIGNTFSFSLVKRLMNGTSREFQPSETTCLATTKTDGIDGLQAAFAAYIIIPCDDEDKFRFAHDRYMQAARSLPECSNQELMHYMIARVLVEDSDHSRADLTGSKRVYEKARHITLAFQHIKDKVSVRFPYRDILYQAAENACESGARTTAISHYDMCWKLLQDDPWDDSKPDVNYQETLTLLHRSADCYWYLGMHEKALAILQITFTNARDAIDKASSWILRSRISAVQGDAFTAFQALKACLAELGYEVPDTTWEQCDTDFLELCDTLENADLAELLDRPVSTDKKLGTVGAVILELSSAAFWSNSLLYYQLAIMMTSMYMKHGTVSQLSLGFVYLGGIAVARFEKIEVGFKLGNIALQLFERFANDAYAYGRGQTLHAVFLGHLQTDMQHQLMVLDRGMEASITSGDRILSLLNLGITAACRLWCSHDLVEVDSFISDVPKETFGNWENDLRGGVFLTAVQQYTRALQGKTKYKLADVIMDDENHSTAQYLEYIDSRASNPKRPRTIYLTYQLVALCRFGHFEKAVEVGEKLLPMMQSIWSMRYYYSNLMYLSFAYMALFRTNPDYPKRSEILEKVKSWTEKIRQAASFNDINYRVWICLLEAEYAEFTGEYGKAISSYEAALDHCELNGIILDNALTYELYGEALVRRNALRPARRVLMDSISTYERVSAFGKAEQLSLKYAWLLEGKPGLPHTVDVGCQTTIESSLKLDQTHLSLGAEQAETRTQLWAAAGENGDLSSQPKRPGAERSSDPALSALGLDVLDLASILESSQVLSSELQVDRLLAKMCEIIIESTAADLGAIVVEGDQVDWQIAAVGGPDGVTSHLGSMSLETVEDHVAWQITRYVLRFKEDVFAPNFLDDERFSNVSEAYRLQNPDGKSIICLPILHGENKLLGSIYVEGPPQSFTERNTTVLRLLVSQIAISLANALLFKEVEKVSASNQSMIEMQKRALAQAREAEIKAKQAETEAIRNMKLKEEAAKAKSLFLANVSHELRTPLNGVLGMSELLKGTPLSAEQDSYANSIRMCADTLLTLINDLLDFTKLEAGKMQVFSVPMSLAESIHEVVRALAFTNNEKNLETKVDLEPIQNLFVFGDPVRLNQILMNLLSNSYKFTNANGIVTVKAVVNWQDASSVEITCSVADTGIGISEEQKQKLFRPFSQIESSSSRSYQGTGLGLSICKAIIENVLGGKIWLDSIPDVGTTVSFTLRFQKVAKAESRNVNNTQRNLDVMARFSSNEAPATPPLIDLSKVSRQDLKICIAEDNPLNQKIAVSFVKKLGFNCEAFPDGQKAVHALENASKLGKPFHLVLMDCQMPVMDGYDATRTIRKSPDAQVRDVLIIAMTASAIRGDREKCLEAGMNNYLAKPVRADTLKVLLESYLSQEPKPMPNLQSEATKIAESVLREAQENDHATLAERPQPDRKITAQVRLTASDGQT